jgi:hypothetical protein
MPFQRKFKKKLIASQQITTVAFACITFHATVSATPNNLEILQQGNLIPTIPAPLLINQGEIHQHLVQARGKLNKPPLITKK